MAKFNPDLIAWAPLQEELSRQRPLISTYRADFWPQKTPTAIPQLLVPRPIQPVLGTLPLRTTYRHTYSHCQPSPSISTDMLTGQVVSNPVQKEITFAYVNGRSEQPMRRLMRAQSAPSLRLTVSDCLSWHLPESTATS
uniref:Uncharacterized protein n=1 Tax=Latimeria chalumnae TaxID=7897 RepID=M3XH37_LATCH